MLICTEIDLVMEKSKFYEEITYFKNADIVMVCKELWIFPPNGCDILGGYNKRFRRVYEDVSCIPSTILLSMPASLMISKILRLLSNVFLFIQYSPGT